MSGLSLGLGVGLTRRGGGGAAPTIASLFADGQQGAWFDPSTNSTLNQVSTNDGAAADAANDPVGYMADRSGRGNNATQATASKRPTYQTGPARLALDKVDDVMGVTVPVTAPDTGWTGTMIIGTDVGTASYEVTIPSGAYEIGGRDNGKYFPGGALVGQVIRNGSLTAGEKAAAEAEMVANGAVASYGAVTNMSGFWQSRAEITVFPLIDMSSVTNVSSAWANCNVLVALPLFDFSALTDGTIMCRGCRDLTTVPAGLFDNIQGGSFNQAFTATNLTQASIDNILVSLVASNITAGTRVFGQSGGSAPSVAVGQPAIDTLRARGWAVSVTGGY
jgi:hypothetical protein